MSNSKNVCGKCRQVIPNRRFVSCTHCHKNYDLVCADVCDKRFALIVSDPDSKKKWKCKFCAQSRLPILKATPPPPPGRGSKPSLPADVSPVFDLKVNNNNIRANSKIDVSNSSESEIFNRTMIQNGESSLVLELRLLREQITIMNATLGKVVDSVQRCHEKVDECSVKLTDIDERLSTLEACQPQPENEFVSPVASPKKSKAKRRKNKPTSKDTSTPPAKDSTKTNITEKRSPDVTDAHLATAGPSKHPSTEKNREKLDSDDDSSDNELNPHDWQVQRNKRRRQKHSFQYGTAGPDATTLRAIEPRKYIHLWNMASGKEEVQAYLQHTCGSGTFTIEELRARGDYKSYKIGVHEPLFEKFMSPTLWPNNARIREWMPFRAPRPNK
ncbi:hypothetical protein NE865_09667 [Phthorimaea operculella]|nr:hypothetical protein NE865_09667 [Phthorimaea operculella]